MFRSLILVAAVLPVAALAAGGGSSSAPKPSETTTQCNDGQVWDTGSQSCVDVKSNLLDDDALYEAVREFAYIGQLANAQATLAAMPDQSDDRVLTYWGFTHRKLDSVEIGMTYCSESDTSYLFPRISSSVSSARRSRVRISLALLVHLKGFGFSLWSAG